MSSCASSLDDGLLFEDKINGITVYTKSLITVKVDYEQQQSEHPDQGLSGAGKKNLCATKRDGRSL